MWTSFWDMHSGGGRKLSASMIYIEAPEEQAVTVFKNRFNRNPYWATCPTCGSDYSIDEHESLERATAYLRDCEWSNEAKGYVEGEKSIPLDRYIKNQGTDIMVIYKDDINPSELIDDGSYPDRDDYDEDY